MIDTTPIFIVGSGRCGTAMTARMLAGVPHIESHHEYVRDAYQRDAALHYLEILSRPTMMLKLSPIFGSAVHYSSARYFVDSSHKHAWTLRALYEMFPNARFVHLVRDGRRVASSFFHKLNMCDDRSVAILRSWFSNQAATLPPPIEPIWWPASSVKLDCSRFERCCHHWTETNRVIVDSLSRIPSSRSIRIKLEDLQVQRGSLEKFLRFFDLEVTPEFTEFVRVPRHVRVPVDFPLTAEQGEQFQAICGGMMNHLGYDGKDYEVNYGV